MSVRYNIQIGGFYKKQKDHNFQIEILSKENGFYKVKFIKAWKWRHKGDVCTYVLENPEETLIPLNNKLTKGHLPTWW